MKTLYDPFMDLRNSSSLLNLAAIALLISMLGPFAYAQAPAQQSAAPTEAILRRAREQALQYTANLPNFICTQTVLRYGQDRDTQRWKVNDKLTLSLSYSDKGESYHLLMINDKKKKKSFQDVGGVKSNGEFGTLLAWVFRPESHTEFGQPTCAGAKQMSSRSI